MHTGNNFYELSNAVMVKNSVKFFCLNEPTYQDYINNNNETIGCGNEMASILIFYSFWIIVSLIFINLFIAIILEGYASTVSISAKWFN